MANPGGNGDMHNFADFRAVVFRRSDGDQVAAEPEVDHRPSLIELRQTKNLQIYPIQGLHRDLGRGTWRTPSNRQ